MATTKAYSTQLVLMDLIGLYLADLLGTVEPAEYHAILEEMEALPEKMTEVLTHVRICSTWPPAILTTIPFSSSAETWITHWGWRDL